MPCLIILALQTAGPPCGPVARPTQESDGATGPHFTCCSGSSPCRQAGWSQESQSWGLCFWSPLDHTRASHKYFTKTFNMYSWVAKATDCRVGRSFFLFKKKSVFVDLCVCWEVLIWKTTSRYRGPPLSQLVGWGSFVKWRKHEYSRHTPNKHSTTKANCKKQKPYPNEI